MRAHFKVLSLLGYPSIIAGYFIFLPFETFPFVLLPLPSIQYVMWVTMFHVF